MQLKMSKNISNINRNTYPAVWISSVIIDCRNCHNWRASFFVFENISRLNVGKNGWLIVFIFDINCNKVYNNKYCFMYFRLFHCQKCFIYIPLSLALCKQKKPLKFWKSVLDETILTYASGKYPANFFKLNKIIIMFLNCIKLCI